MTECQKQVLITNNNKQEKHKPKPDKTQNMTCNPFEKPKHHIVVWLVS